MAFTRSPASFRRSLRDVVRQFNTYVTDDKLDVVLNELSDLLDAGLLSLRPGRSGETVQSHVRGLLGLLVAVQALRNLTAEGHDRIILSLDKRTGATLASPCRRPAPGRLAGDRWGRRTVHGHCGRSEDAPGHNVRVHDHGRQGERSRDRSTAVNPSPTSTSL